jgi:hypothetical protein
MALWHVSQIGDPPTDRLARPFEDRPTSLGNFLGNNSSRFLPSGTMVAGLAVKERHFRPSSERFDDGGHVSSALLYRLST